MNYFVTELSATVTAVDMDSMTGMDLAALMSAGEQLRRVKEVHTEIINDPSYKKGGKGSMSSEEEFHSYMASMGFSPYREIPAPERWVVDVFYRNDSWTE